MSKRVQYAIIGNGGVARHMMCYFKALSLPFVQWYRAGYSVLQLHDQLKQSSHALILISDDAIESFVNQHLIGQYNQLTCVHFSGALVSPLIASAHPLQTFSATHHYSLEDYKKIPFILEKGGLLFSHLLPGLTNPHYYIHPDDKGFYHAMCVMANNMTTVLWQKFYKEMQGRFQLKQKDLEPLLQQTFKNLLMNPETALTGPLVRGDTKTLEKNIQSLQGDPCCDIFQAIVKQYKQLEVP